MYIYIGSCAQSYIYNGWSYNKINSLPWFTHICFIVNFDSISTIFFQRNIHPNSIKTPSKLSSESKTSTTFKRLLSCRFCRLQFRTSEHFQNHVCNNHQDVLDTTGLSYTEILNAENGGGMNRLKKCYTTIQCKIELYVFNLCKYTSMFMCRAGQLSAQVKCTSRLEGKNWVSDCTNLNRDSNQ